MLSVRTFKNILQYTVFCNVLRSFSYAAFQYCMQLDTHLKQIIYRSKAPLAALASLHLLVVWMLWLLLAWILLTITATKQINYT